MYTVIVIILPNRTVNKATCNYNMR